MPVRTYVYDGDAVLQEADGAGVTQATYTRTGGGYGELLSRHDGTSSRYYEPDALGSTDALANDAQAVTDRWAYRAYGAATQTAGSDPTPFIWVGRQGYFADSQTSLYLLGSGTRHYDPQTAQFLSHDPIRFAAGDANLYRYVTNRPVTNIDPSGWAPPGGDICNRGRPDLPCLQYLLYSEIPGQPFSLLAYYILSLPCPLYSEEATFFSDTQLQQAGSLTRPPFVSDYALYAMRMKAHQCDTMRPPFLPVITSIACAAFLGELNDLIPRLAFPLEPKEKPPLKPGQVYRPSGFKDREKADQRIRQLVYLGVTTLGKECGCLIKKKLEENWEKKDAPAEQKERLRKMLDNYPLRQLNCKHPEPLPPPRIVQPASAEQCVQCC